MKASGYSGTEIQKIKSISFDKQGVFYYVKISEYITRNYSKTDSIQQA